MSEVFYIGVDVGTGSVRAGLVSQDGCVMEHATRAITIWNTAANTFEQSSDEIWEAVCITVQQVTEGYNKKSIKGIGFDATCSLVVLDETFEPVNVGVPSQSVDTGDKSYVQNIIMWLDHRAEEEANLINASKHQLLNYVGGTMSLEMEMPKLRWLKHKHPKAWSKAYHCFDLPDFLTWRATGCLSRSLCSLVCKWAYDAQEKQWNVDFLRNVVQLGDVADNLERLGKEVQLPGQPVVGGLSTKAAEELGLEPSTPVGTSLIDAHCGALGLLSTSHPSLQTDITSRLAMICGTSTCHMIMSEKPLFVPGVWGPYDSAILPDLYTAEGGQSATGKALDHIIQTHPAYQELQQEADLQNKDIYSVLEDLLRKEAAAQGLLWEQCDKLTSDLHVYPDFHGNRSPLADPLMRGSIVGLSFDTSLLNLALLFLATVQGLAYGTVHIVDQLVKCNHVVDAVYVCGGLTKSDLFVRCLSNALGKPVVTPKEKESVILGAAMLGMSAASEKRLTDIVEELNSQGDIVHPDKSTYDYHCWKFDVYLSMIGTQKTFRYKVDCFK